MEKDIEAEAKKLYDYYNKLGMEYKKLLKKKEDSSNKDAYTVEITIILDKINKFKNEYTSFIKERKNSMGKFDMNKYIEIKTIEQKMEKEKNNKINEPFSFINPKQYSTYEFVDEQKVPLSKENIPDNNLSDMNEKNEVVVYYGDTHMINLFKKQKELMRKTKEKNIGLCDLTPEKRIKVLKSCDNFLNELIFNLVCIANTREKKIIKKKDLYFLLKFYDINLKKEEKKLKKTFL